jgi:hypothetical protein
MSLDRKRKGCQFFVYATFALTHLLSAPTFAQENARPATETWRPKDGTYVGPGHDYDSCLDFGDLIVEFAEKRIAGNEYECKISRLTDTVPGTIKLDVMCTDIERQKPHKEVILLKRIGQKTISYRQTTDGKFKYAGEQLFYCHEEAQRMYLESKKSK